MTVRYIARVGINWPDKSGEARAEARQEVPAEVVNRSQWLLEQGLVAEETVEGGED